MIQNIKLLLDSGDVGTALNQLLTAGNTGTLDIFEQDDRGYNFLHVAVEYITQTRGKILPLLLSVRGVDGIINQYNGRGGVTPLYMYLSLPQPSLFEDQDKLNIRQMLEQGASPVQKSRIPSGYTPLHVFVDKNMPLFGVAKEIFYLITGFMPMSKVLDNSRNTPLHVMMERAVIDIEILEDILVFDISVGYSKNVFGETPLFVLFKRFAGFIDTRLAMLIAMMVDILGDDILLTRDGSYNTILHVLAGVGDVFTIQNMMFIRYQRVFRTLKNTINANGDFPYNFYDDDILKPNAAPPFIFEYPSLREILPQIEIKNAARIVNLEGDVLYIENTDLYAKRSEWFRALFSTQPIEETQTWLVPTLGRDEIEIIKVFIETDSILTTTTVSDISLLLIADKYLIMRMIEEVEKRIIDNLANNILEILDFILRDPVIPPAEKLRAHVWWYINFNMKSLLTIPSTLFQQYVMEKIRQKDGKEVELFKRYPFLLLKFQLEEEEEEDPEKSRKRRRV